MSDRKYTFRFTMEATVNNTDAETENEAEQVIENFLRCWMKFVKTSDGPPTTLTYLNEVEFTGYK